MIDARQILCARLSVKTPRNKLESLGYLFLCFILFLRSRTFPLNMFQSFLQETFRKLFNLAGRTVEYGPRN